MKKIVTLFLLFVFLLNVLGFYGIFLGLQFRNEADQLKAFDSNQYSAEDEITFAIPLTVPYFTKQDTEYSRTDGEFEHNGEIFRKVKQKLTTDTLYVVCVKDQKSKDIRNALAEYVKTFSDKAPVSKGQQAKSTLSFSKDYFSTVIVLENSIAGWNESVPFAELQEHYRAADVVTPDSPPRIA